MLCGKTFRSRSSPLSTDLCTKNVPFPLLKEKPHNSSLPSALTLNQVAIANVSFVLRNPISVSSAREVTRRHKPLKLAI
jgi:hypothetical protein